MDPAAWAGAAGIAATALLLLGLGSPRHRLRLRPWLLVLYAINAGRAGVSRQALRVVDPTDVALLLLAGATYAGFWPGPGAQHLVWMSIAVAQPLLGIVLLLATRQWGRSGLMGGALALSVLLILDHTWTAAGWLGAVGSALLLAGDFATTGRRSPPLAVSLVLGYGALTAWFACIGSILLFG
ncbi:MAG TPA: hypothetical protein VFL69_00910 [Marmoricola sp.]|jgi:hypothetical protein|nr:hypothetical protein [Marmoricola sp.]